jgi:hypothetical protein
LSAVHRRRLITEWCESEHFRYASQSSKQIVVQLPWIGTVERVHTREQRCHWPLFIFSPQVRSNYLLEKLGEWVLRIGEQFLNGLFALFIAARRVL